MKLRLTAFVALSVFLIASKPLLAQRVVMIGLDGFSAQGFKNTKHPNLDRIFSEGAWSLTTRPVMPSVTLPNWTSHLTGSGPEEHGVSSNSWTLQKYELEPLQKDAQGYYPSIFKILKEQKPDVKTAYYFNWKALINPINTRYIDQVSFEENDGFRDNYAKALSFIEQNRKSPTFVFLYSVRIDHAGHSHKWMSPEYVSAIEEADSAIGKFLDDLKAKDLYKDTHFIFATDHGGKENGHGGMSMLEMQVPWAVAGPMVKKRGEMTSFNSNKNTSFVIAKIFGLKKLPECWTGVLPKNIF